MQFKVGEIAILTRCFNHPSLNGMECTILDGLKMRTPCNTNVPELCYYVEDMDGKHWYATQEQLKRKPPKQDTTTWEEFRKVCGFDPSKVSV